MIIPTLLCANSYVFVFFVPAVPCHVVRLYISTSTSTYTLCTLQPNVTINGHLQLQQAGRLVVCIILIFNTYMQLTEPTTMQYCYVCMEIHFRKKGHEDAQRFIAASSVCIRLWFVVLINIICLVYDYKTALNLKVLYQPVRRMIIGSVSCVQCVQAQELWNKLAVRARGACTQTALGTHTHTHEHMQHKKVPLRTRSDCNFLYGVPRSLRGRGYCMSSGFMVRVQTAKAGRGRSRIL